MMKIHWWQMLVVLGLMVLVAAGAQAVDTYWVAGSTGNWSNPASWSAGVPGVADTAYFSARGVGDAVVDAAFTGTVKGVVVQAGYTGVITQARSLIVTGDMQMAGTSKIGWTFTEDQPATLTVKGNLIVASGAYLTCPRSSIQGEGAGRTITVGKNLSVLGAINADGKGFMKGPGTPIVPVAKDDPNAATMEDRYVGGANIEALKNACIVSPAGPGHGGRGAGIYRNPNGQYTAQPHSYYWTEPLGSGSWKYPGGGTYGSITAPTSLGSGTADDPKFDPKKPYAFDAQDTFWTHKGAYGGGAIKIIVGGIANITGRISANGALAGETGASGGAIFITAGKFMGNGVICANGSDGPGHGHGRGGGGGGRVAVIIKGAAATDKVRLQAFGGEGRWSPAAAAGTIYLETPKDQPGKGTLVIDNANQPVRSMYDICTSLSDNTGKAYTFASVVLKNHAILYIGKGNTLTATKLNADNANVLVDGKFNCSAKPAKVRTETTSPQDEVSRQLGQPVTVYTFGKAYTMKEELLNRSCQISVYPYKSSMDVGIDLSTYAYPTQVNGVKSATIEVFSQADSKPVTRTTMRFNAKQFAETSILLPPLKDGNYLVQLTLDNGMKPAPMQFERQQLPWEHSKLGETEKIYPPFEPLTVEDKTINLSSQRAYVLNGFGLFDKVLSEGREITAGPMSIKIEGAAQDWQFGAGKFTTVKGNVVDYSASAETGAVKITTNSSTEFDGCTRVEMDLLPGAQPQTISRMWIEIPLKDSEMPLFHALQFAGMRWNYAGKTPRGGQIEWETAPPAWSDRRPPIWSVKPGTEGQENIQIWNSTDVRNINTFTVNPFVPYLWLGGAERGLAWFADSDKDWVPDLKKPGQTITREGDRLVLRLYLINKPVIISSKHHIVFGLQASPTRPMMPDWRTVDRFAIWGYMTPPLGMFCCTKFPIDCDVSLYDKLIQNGKDTKAGKKASPQFFYDKVDSEKAKGWPEDMTADSYIRHWVTDPWNNAMVNGPLPSIYYEEHWTDPSQIDVDQYGNEWACRRYLGYWPIREKNRVVYDSPYATATNLTGRFLSGQYSDSLVDFSVYYANELLKRGISLYFDNTYLKTSMNPSMDDAHFTENGQVQPSSQIWKQREYYKRIWNIINEYNEKGANPPLWFSQHMTNSLILPWNTWTTCNLDNENTWTDVARKIKPAAFPWDYLLTETAGRQVGVPCHSHYPVGGTGSTPMREWGMRRVHEITNANNPWDANSWPIAMDRTFLAFGYGAPNVQVINYWSDTSAIHVANDDVKWLGMLKTDGPLAMLVLQSYSYDPTSTSVKIDGKAAWLDVETRQPIPGNADGSLQVDFKDSYGTRVLIAAPTAADLNLWQPPAAPAR